MKKKILFLILVILILFSCNNNKNNKNKQEAMSMIIIEFYPAFHEPVTFIVNLIDTTMLVKRAYGSKTRFIFDDKEIIEKDAIATNNFKFSKNTLNFLKDTISFNQDDFVDREKMMCDGIVNSLFFIFNNEKIIDICLINSFTQNQKVLFFKLIDEAVLQISDEKIIKYLSELKKYYH